VKEFWTRFAKWVNGLTLRERSLVFTALVGLLGALTYVLFISPLLEQQKILVAQLDSKSSAMDSQREAVNLEMLKRGRDRFVELNADILRVQADIDATEREIAALSASGADAAAISTMLNRVLRRSDKVILVRVAQVSVEGSTAATARGAGPGSGTARGGLDITLSGGYLDLMEYLASLEKGLPTARWGALWLKAESSPAQLTARIVTSLPE